MSSSNYEKYLRGEPLNEELKALKEGRLTVFPSFEFAQASESEDRMQQDPDTPLSEAELSALREMRQGPGWPVLQKLMERATILHTRAATRLSQDDPLARSTELAQTWAYLNMLKRAHREIDALVEAVLWQPKEAESEAHPAI